MKTRSSLSFLKVLTVFAFLFSSLVFLPYSWAAGALVPLPPNPDIPSGNLETPQKVLLGKTLFFDPNLSANGRISCASCHVPSRGYADPRPVSIGVGGKHGTRNASSALNAAYFSRQFWDGRAGSLEEQAIGPLTNPVEMANTSNRSVVRRLEKKAHYRRAFQEVFGGPVSIDRIAKAIAAYERTLVTPMSAYDQFMMGNKSALTPQEKRGFALFKGKGRCVLCHNGALLSDQGYHNLGVSGSKDVGRYAISHDPVDKGRFRTPGLRNVALTAPYMHDGSVKTLMDVVEFYNQGGGKSAYPKDALLIPLHLSKSDERDLVAFLNALTGETKHEMSMK
ncbi:MAG: cytochrome-c peroxidase [Leptospirillum sp.]